MKGQAIEVENLRVASTCTLLRAKVEFKVIV